MFPRSPSRAETATLIVPLLPTVLAFFLRLDLSYSPVSTDLTLFLSPWAVPLDFGDLVSRLLQLGLIPYTLPPLPWLWAATSTAALLRAPLGFLLTRSVGWAAPVFFSHRALYEPMTGWGPGLVVWQAMDPVHEWSLAAAAGFALLERRPWTYAVTLGVAMGVLVLRAALPTVQERLVEKPRQGPLRTQLAALALAALVLPLFSLLRPPLRLPFPATSLDVLILSFPRPQNGDIVLQKTVDSYAPFLNEMITLNGFTHSTDHAAFAALREQGYNFYVDEDQHPDDEWGHYLHLAEAFRWAEDTLRGEWVMLAEDDFPLCPGAWDVISTVMAELESEREVGRIRAGFIGTGGSGLIMHRSYLPLLQVVLREYSRSASRLPPGVHRRAPDQVVQDCLRGTPGSLCERRDEQRMIISSRIVMDHIGGMATTTEGKALNSDKWRCGWRHAWHGAADVDVVVV